jgi:hypothetical protein
MIIDILNIRRIEESSVYQGIFAKGRAEEARRTLIRRGTKTFGPPNEQDAGRIGRSVPTARAPGQSPPRAARCR